MARARSIKNYQSVFRDLCPAEMDLSYRDRGRSFNVSLLVFFLGTHIDKIGFFLVDDIFYELLHANKLRPYIRGLSLLGKWRYWPGLAAKSTG